VTYQQKQKIISICTVAIVYLYRSSAGTLNILDFNSKAWIISREAILALSNALFTLS